MNRRSIGLGEEDQKDGPVMSFQQLPAPGPQIPGTRLAIYTHSDRTFTCVATQVEAPYTRYQQDRPPRLR